MSTDIQLTNALIMQTLDNKKQCPVCLKRFTQHANLRRHFRLHTGEKPFKCETCPKQFSDRSSLKWHLITHNNTRNIQCNYCTKLFYVENHARRHELTHIQDQSYICNICGKTLRRLDSLKYHLKNHTGELPYVCDICGKSFSLKSVLKKHKQSFRCGGSGRKPVLCKTKLKEIKLVVNKETQNMTIDNSIVPCKKTNDAITKPLGTNSNTDKIITKTNKELIHYEASATNIHNARKDDSLYVKKSENTPEELPVITESQIQDSISNKPILIKTTNHLLSDEIDFNRHDINIISNPYSTYKIEHVGIRKSNYDDVKSSGNYLINTTMENTEVQPSYSYTHCNNTRTHDPCKITDMEKNSPMFIKSPDVTSLLTPSPSTEDLHLDSYTFLNVDDGRHLSFIQSNKMDHGGKDSVSSHSSKVASATRHDYLFPLPGINDNYHSPFVKEGIPPINISPKALSPPHNETNFVNSRSPYQNIAITDVHSLLNINDKYNQSTTKRLQTVITEENDTNQSGSILRNKNTFPSADVTNYCNATDGYDGSYWCGKSVFDPNITIPYTNKRTPSLFERQSSITIPNMGEIDTLPPALLSSTSFEEDNYVPNILQISPLESRTRFHYPHSYKKSKILQPYELLFKQPFNETRCDICFRPSGSDQDRNLHTCL